MTCRPPVGVAGCADGQSMEEMSAWARLEYFRQQVHARLKRFT